MELTSALLAYVIPAVLITMLPGPDTAMVLATSVKAGHRAAVRAAWGVGTGILLWAAAAAAGLAAALNSSTVLYDAFRLGCAAYLLVLAYQAIRGSFRKDAVADEPPTATRRLPSLGWGFRRALLTCLLNPKLGVFFVVVLPQFVPTDMAVGPATLALGTLHASVAVLWYLLVCACASAAGRLLARRRAQAWLDRVSGAAFFGFGIRLAAETR